MRPLLPLLFAALLVSAAQAAGLPSQMRGRWNGTLVFRLQTNPTTTGFSSCCAEVYREQVDVQVGDTYVIFSSLGATASCGPSPAGDIRFTDVEVESGSCYSGTLQLTAAGSPVPSAPRGFFSFDSDDGVVTMDVFSGTPAGGTCPLVSTQGSCVIVNGTLVSQTIVGSLAQVSTATGGNPNDSGADKPKHNCTVHSECNKCTDDHKCVWCQEKKICVRGGLFGPTQSKSKCAVDWRFGQCKINGNYIWIIPAVAGVCGFIVIMIPLCYMLCCQRKKSWKSINWDLTKSADKYNSTPATDAKRVELDEKYASLRQKLLTQSSSSSNIQ